MTSFRVVRIFMTLLAAVAFHKGEINGMQRAEFNSLLGNDNDNDYFWMEQKLDHFNPFDKRKWQMRYISNTEFAVDGGPLFICVGGENGIDPNSLRSGHLHDMARDNHAYMFLTEHRYYGKSQPFSDLATKNLQFLTSRQALADLHHFVLTIKSMIPGAPQSKIFMVGGSYSGSLAAWFRRQYPDLVDIVWASSAPIAAKASLTEYNVIAGHTYREIGGADCYYHIKKGINRLEQIFTSDQAIYAKSLLNLCNDFNVKNIFDLGSLFSTIATAFTMSTLDNLNQVSRNCDFIRQYPDELTAIVKFFTHSMNSSGCEPVSFRDTTDFLKDTSLNSINHDSRAWFYQVCNEFGLFATTDSPQQPFGKMCPLHFYAARCEFVFGEIFSGRQIEDNIIKTNSYYGGLGPIASKVYATVGEFDPYSGAGYRAQDGVKMIAKSTHCEDLNSINSMDSMEMRNAKETISQLVSESIR